MYYYEQDIIDTNKVDIYELFSPDQVFNVICYHINDKSGLYPFIQFLLYKDKLGNKFTMPQSNKQDLITNIKASLLSMGILEEYIDVDKIVFKGYYKDKIKPLKNNVLVKQTFSLLVDISGIDLYKLLLVNANPAWFALFSEIVNEKSICNIPISESVVNYFEANTCLAKIYADNVDKMVYYPIPSVAYNVSEFKRAEIKGLFGESKVENKDYYYFQTTFKQAVIEYKEGNYNINKHNNIKVTFNTYFHFQLEKGINRYAFFPEKNKVLENLSEFDLVNYSTNFYIGNVFIKQYEQHVPLSYHILHTNGTNHNSYKYNFFTNNEISINYKEYNIM